MRDGDAFFDWITDDIAVGGRYGDGVVPDLWARWRFAAVIDLRAEAGGPAELLREHRIRHLHLPTDDLGALDPLSISAGVAFAGAVLDAGGRILIHCEHGIGRSATLALCLLSARGMAPLEALERAKSARGRVSPSPEQFACWAAYLAELAPQAPGGWTVPGFDEFAAIAYRHLPREAGP